MNWRINLQNRPSNKIISKRSNKIDQVNTIILKSSSDWGIVRNGGRRGSIYGPESIMSCFESLNCNHTIRPYYVKEVADQKLESTNFDQAQKIESQKISDTLKSFQGDHCIHLGGGHDHLYTFVKNNPAKKIHIINIDAHLDTRNDKENHSGTPFRQLANERRNKIRLTQVGIHAFANTLENYNDLPCSMRVFSIEQFRKKNLKEVMDIKNEEYTILSLDCDALSAEILEGVSAVNHNGLNSQEIQGLIENYKNSKHLGPKNLGLYEFNPKLENLSQKGARFLAYLMYQFIN